jgi:Skp family chaperone for outer membrane proteins
MKKPRDLRGEIERLDTMMNQIDADLRVMRSGLMNDEKRKRIEKLKTEKSKHGKNLQKLQRELYSRENEDSSKRF